MFPRASVPQHLPADWAADFNLTPTSRLQPHGSTWFDTGSCLHPRNGWARKANKSASSALSPSPPPVVARPLCGSTGVGWDPQNRAGRWHHGYSNGSTQGPFSGDDLLSVMAYILRGFFWTLIGLKCLNPKMPFHHSRSM